MKSILGIAAGTALVWAHPALAQVSEGPVDSPPEETQLGDSSDADPWGDGMSEGMGEGDGEEGLDALAMMMVANMITSLFQADPLGPEAEARLPLANSAAASLVPEGVYGQMMQQMADAFLGPIFEMAGAGSAMSADELAGYTGRPLEDVAALSDEQRAELTTIFDPVYETRSVAQFDGIMTLVQTVFTQIEPGMRTGLARAYASRFTDAELAELNAFFATPTGAKFASQNLLALADPQVIGGTMESVPGLIETLPPAIERLENPEEGLPEQRNFDDLTPSEQRRAAELLGIDRAVLGASMAEAQAAADAEANLDAAIDLLAEEAPMEAEPVEP